jgi:hypothetical protein
LPSSPPRVPSHEMRSKRRQKRGTVPESNCQLRERVDRENLDELGASVLGAPNLDECEEECEECPEGCIQCEEVCEEDLTSEEYNRRLGKSQQKQKNWLDAIIRKWSQQSDVASDEIDLRTGRIVVDNGHLESMSDAKDDDEENDDEEDDDEEQLYEEDYEEGEEDDLSRSETPTLHHQHATDFDSDDAEMADTSEDGEDYDTEMRDVVDTTATGRCSATTTTPSSIQQQLATKNIIHLPSPRGHLPAITASTVIQFTHRTELPASQTNSTPKSSNFIDLTLDDPPFKVEPDEDSGAQASTIAALPEAPLAPVPTTHQLAYRSNEKTQGTTPITTCFAYKPTIRGTNALSRAYVRKPRGIPGAQRFADLRSPIVLGIRKGTKNIVTATFASNGSFTMRVNKLNIHGREEIIPPGVSLSVDFESIDLRAPWRGYERKIIRWGIAREYNRVLKTCGHSTVDLTGFGAEYHVSNEPVIALISTRLVDLHSRAEFAA